MSENDGALVWEDVFTRDSPDATAIRINLKLVLCHAIFVEAKCPTAQTLWPYSKCACGSSMHANNGIALK